MFNLKILSLMLISTTSFAFDLEDYATTMRATRDAYVRAQQNVADFKPRYDQFLNYLKANCIDVVEPIKFELKNLDGIISGSCKRDGEDAYVNGGVMPKRYKQKIGDIFFNYFERMPHQIMADRVGNWPFPRSLGFMGDMEDWAQMFRQFRDQGMANASAAFRAMEPRLVRNTSCVRTDTSIEKIARAKNPYAFSGQDSGGISDEQRLEAAYNEVLQDLVKELRELRDSYQWVVRELLLSTPPYLAAVEAYNAATSVYTRELDCTGPGTPASHKLVWDPYMIKQEYYMGY